MEKWIIFQFTPHQIITLPKWMLFQKPFFKSSLQLNGHCSIQTRPPNSSDDLCLLFCLILLLTAANVWKLKLSRPFLSGAGTK